MRDRRSSQPYHRHAAGLSRNHPRARIVSLTLAALALLGLLMSTAGGFAQESTIAAEKPKPAPKVTGVRKWPNLVLKRGSFETKPAGNLTAARDAGSGKATGKRQFKPINFTKQYDNATPMLAAPAKDPGMLNQGGLLDGSSAGNSPAAKGSPMSRGGSAGGR